MKRQAVAVFVLLSLILAAFAPAALAQDAVTCSVSGTNERIDTNFVNDFAFDITSHWVDYDCVEGEGTFIAAGTSFPAGTYDGHEFIFRNAATGEVVASYVALIADSGGDVLISTYAGRIPAWHEDASEPEAVEPEVVAPETKKTITLVPTNDAALPTADCSVDDGTQIEMTFWNDTGTNNEIYMYWLNWDCVEEEIYLYQDDYYYEFYETYVGHDFTFRNPAGELLAYHRMSAEDNGEWTPLSELITVEVTTTEVPAEAAAPLSVYEDYVKSVNSARIANSLPEVGVNPVLQNFAQVLASRVDITAFSSLENVGGADTFNLTDNDFATEIAAELGLTGNIQPLAIHAEGLTKDNILLVLDRVLAYEGWQTEEIMSFALYQQGDLFFLITSDAQAPVVEEEEWAEFEYEETAPAQDSAVIEPVTGIFAAGDVEAGISYPFDAVEGRLYVLLYKSDDYDTYLYLSNSSGVDIAVNDDGAGNLNSIIVFIAPESGVYTARLSSFAPNPKGNYTFAVAQPDSEIRGAVVERMDPVKLDFEVVAGVTYFAEVSSTEVDTTLSVLDSGGNQITANDDYYGTNSFVFFTASETGTYTLSVNSYNGGQSGQFRLLTGSFK